jgi:hypothetical protein
MALADDLNLMMNEAGWGSWFPTLRKVREGWGTEFLEAKN